MDASHACVAAYDLILFCTMCSRSLSNSGIILLERRFRSAGYNMQSPRSLSHLLSNPVFVKPERVVLRVQLTLLSWVPACLCLVSTVQYPELLVTYSSRAAKTIIFFFYGLLRCFCRPNDLCMARHALGHISTAPIPSMSCSLYLLPYPHFAFETPWGSLDDDPLYT